MKVGEKGRKTSLEKPLEFNPLASFGQTDNHEVLRKFIADSGNNTNKGKPSPSSIYNRLSAVTQKPCSLRDLDEEVSAGELPRSMNRLQAKPSLQNTLNATRVRNDEKSHVANWIT